MEKLKRRSRDAVASVFEFKEHWKFMVPFISNIQYHEFPISLQSEISGRMCKFGLESVF